jgi:hypothetical protein
MKQPVTEHLKESVRKWRHTAASKRRTEKEKGRGNKDYTNTTLNGEE